MAIASRPPPASVWNADAPAVTPSPHSNPSSSAAAPPNTTFPPSSSSAFQRHVNASARRTAVSSPVRVVSAVVKKSASPSASPQQESHQKRASFTLPSKAASTTALSQVGIDAASDATPDLSSSETWSSSGTSPATPQRSASAMPTSPVAKAGDPSVVMAARDRPIFQKERALSNSVSSSSLTSNTSSNGSTAPLRVKNGNVSTPTRRQLMPAIPVRRGSAITESSSAKEHTLQPKTSTPSIGNQTNIQSLAQAIAARAQHVAATKAAAALHPQQAKQSTTMDDVDPSATATSGTGAIPATMTGSGANPLISSLFSQPQQIAADNRVSVLSLPSDYGDDESDSGENSTAPDSHTTHAFGGVTQPKLNGTVSEMSRAERDRVAQSFRWSQGDWADYAAVLSREIEVGASGDSDYVANEKTPTVSNTTGAATATASAAVVVPPTADDIVQVRRNSQIGPSRTINGDGLSGLGLGDLGGVVAADANRKATENDGQEAVVRSTSEPYNSPLLAHVTSSIASPKTPDAASVAGSATSPDGSITPSSSKRRTRPAPLSLVSSPSASRSLASPSMGGRTPPPTMPPTEPLPPLPADLSSNLRRLRTSVDSTKHGPLSFRSSGYSDAPAPNAAEGAAAPEAMAQEDAGVQKRDRKRASDPTESRSAFMRNHADVAAARGGAEVNAFPRKNSLPHNVLQSAASITPASLSAQSIALVRANRLSTLAGAEHAQAMLEQMQREPTYDELRAGRRISQASSSTSSSAQHSGGTSTSSSGWVNNTTRHAGTPATTMDADSVTPMVVTNKTSAPTPVGEEEEEEELREAEKKAGDEGDEDDEGDIEEEEAVVTRVVGTTVKRTPSIVRIASSPRRAGSAQRQSSVPVVANHELTSSGSLGDVDGIVGARRNSETTTLNKDSSAQAESAPRSASVNQARSVVTTSMPAEERSADTSFTGRPSLSMAAQSQRVVVAGADSTSNDTASASLSMRSPSVISLQGLTGTWTPTPVDTPTLLQSNGMSAAGGYSNPNGRDTAGGIGNDSSRASFASSPVDRRTAQPRSDASRMTMSSFAEVTTAFKQLQAEKRTLERIIRATTPLDGMGQNGASLAEYLTTMTGKMEASQLEIRKLLDLLDQQRSVMDYMVDTHRLEMEAQSDELEELKDDFDAVCEEADTHRDNAIRLTEELDAAQRDAVAARAETLRLRSSWQEEGKRKESTIKLLRQARNDLGQLERERDEARSALERGGDGGDGEAASRDEARKRTRSDTSAIRIAALETELAEAKRANDELQRQMQERHEQQQREQQPRASTSSDSPPAASVPLSDADEMERERDMLRERLFQQEKDVAELRAQIALGGGGGGNATAAPVEGDASLAAAAGVGSLPAAREDQVRLLMAQMSEQRTREAQIRKAYRQLRDDYRKVQSAQHNDRKRNQATYNFLGTAGANILPGTTPPTSASGLQTIELAAAADASGADGGTTPTPRHLKRLSLPLVNRAATLLGSTFGNANGGGSSTSGSTRGNDDDPPTPGSATLSARPMSTTLSAASPSLSSSGARRGPRTYSVDFAAHAAKRIATPRTSGESSVAGHNDVKEKLSPRSISLRRLTGEATDDADASDSAGLSQSFSANDDSDVDRHRTGEERGNTSGSSDDFTSNTRITVHSPTNEAEEEGMEHLSTPRQSVVIRPQSYAE